MAFAPRAERLSSSDIVRMICRAYTTQDLRYRAASDSWILKGEPISMGELSRIVAHDTDLSLNRVQLALTKMAWEMSLAARQRLRLWVSMNDNRGRDESELRRWLRLIERPDTSEICHEANVVAMRQFIWQVKRGVGGLAASYHVCPVFWSKEGGTGKSFNLRRLISPIEDFTRFLDVNQLGEKFSGRLFSQTFIAFLDEMAGVEKASVAQLKAILTGKPIDGRSMYSESGFYSENRMSCIATSNISPPHGFVDTTGARRFWSIHCDGEPMHKGSERARALDGINVDEVWRCVLADELSPQSTTTPAMQRYMEEVRDERLRTKSSLEVFLEEACEESAGERWQLIEFMPRYRAFCSSNRIETIRGGQRVLAEALRELGFECVNNANRRALKNVRMIDPEVEAG